MDLYIDIGNTRLKWLYSGDLSASCINSVDYNANNHSYIIHLLKLPENKPRNVYVATVVSNNTISKLIEGIEGLSLRLIFISPVKHFLGLNICYKYPENYGVDRWLALLAALNFYKTACLVVDVGTAITVDYVREDGLHEGGHIIPGLGLIQRSLERCDQISPIDEYPGFSDSLNFSCSTDSAIRNGVLHMVVAYLNKIALDVANKYEVNLLLTGGDAKSLMPFLIDNWVSDELLVFKGIELYAQNTKFENI